MTAITTFTHTTSTLIRVYSGLDVPRQEVFQNVWGNIWSKDLESEKVFHTLLSQKVFSFVNSKEGGPGVVFTKSSFYIKLISPLFLDMLNQPLERGFLLDLVAKIRALRSKIYFVNSDRNQFLQIEDSSHKFYYSVHLNFRKVLPILCSDDKGKRYFGYPSFTRVLSHELIHVYHNVMQMDIQHQRLPPSQRWYIGEEMMTVHGSCAYGMHPEYYYLLSTPYSENRFSEARGEMARIAYTAIAHYRMDTDTGLVANMVLTGAEGSLQQLNFDPKNLFVPSIIEAFQGIPFPKYLLETRYCPEIDLPYQKEIVAAKFATINRLIKMLIQEGAMCMAYAIKRGTIDRH